jgi:hypothetical protein
MAMSRKRLQQFVPSLFITALALGLGMTRSELAGASNKEPPTITAPDYLRVPGGATGPLAGISVADPDDTELTVMLEASSGTMSLLTAGLSFSKGDGTSDSSMTMKGTKAALNAALAGLTFTAPSSLTETVLTVTAIDAGNSSSDTHRTTRTSTIVDAGLVAHWNFDGDQGRTATDVTGRGHNGRINGSRRVTVGSGRGLYHDGNDFVTVDSAADLDLQGPHTIAGWIKPRTSFAAMKPTFPYLINKQDWSGNSGYYFGIIDGNTNRFGMRTLTGSSLADRLEATATISDSGQWIHLAAVSDGAYLKFYRNGALVSSVATAGKLANSNGQTLIIGHGIEGTIDDIRIYNRSLSVGDLAAIATAVPTQIDLEIYAGQDADVLLPSTAHLTASVTGSLAADNNNIVTWLGLLGPGSVTFEHADRLDTFASFSAAGSYILACTVQNKLVKRLDIVVVTVYEAAQLNSGLVAYWPFNEASGATAQDASGNNNHAVITGASRVAGRFSGGLRFNGSAYALANDSTSLRVQAFTISMWAKPDKAFPAMASLYPNLVSKLDYNANAGYYFGVANPDSDVLGTMLMTGTSQALYRRALYQETTATGVWTHLATSFNGSVLRMYRNGAEVMSQAVPTSVINHNAIPLTIGNGFEGDLDDVRIYNRTLSASEINALATQLPNASG